MTAQIISLGSRRGANDDFVVYGKKRMPGFMVYLYLYKKRD